MKPKARKFRIRRRTAPPAGAGAGSGVSGPRMGGGAAHPGPDPEQPGNSQARGGAATPTATGPTAIGRTGSDPRATGTDGPAPQAVPQGARRDVPPGAQRLSAQEESFLSPQEEIEAIKKENLTGRQLRIARREAQKHGLHPTSDLDAVRLLRKNGIDPFKRSDLLELVVSDQQPGAGPKNLPAAIRHAPPPAPQVLTEAERVREVQKVQEQIARRRRRRLALLLVRLSFFVFIPTILTGYYYFRIATPMYATHSEFVIQQADPAGAGSKLGGLLGASGLGNIQDAITVQAYLTSRDAMMRLDREHGFKAHFQQAFIDSIQRLPPDASNEATYRLYKKRIKIGFDPTEGIVKMDVIAATPQASLEFSRALIGYAEEQVDKLTQRLREDQMKGARESYQDAEAKMLAAQKRVLKLQEKRGVLSADAEISSRMQQISAFEVQLRKKRLDLAQMMDNPRPNRTRVAIAQKEIARLESLIQEMRGELTSSNNSTESLASISGELKVAEADLATRQLLLSQALQQLETARIEANRQVRYLSLGVSPVPPDEPTYPKAFEDTVLAFLIFSGLYLLISLTASILREQVSA